MKSSKLATIPPLPNNLIKNIRGYYARINSQKNIQKKQNELLQITKSIDVWLKFYPAAFKKKFYDVLNIPLITNKVSSFKPNKENSFVKKELDNFIRKLMKSSSLKIFIGKDAFILFQAYKKAIEKSKGKKSDFVFLKFSRAFLFNKSNDINYITLTELIHKNTILIPTFSAFYSQYANSLDNTGLYYERIRKKTLSRLHRLNLIRKLNDYKSFQVVDSGMQGGLALPLMRILQHEGYTGGFCLFYCFPWLKKIYKGKVQTQDINIFVQLENDSLHSYNSASKKRSGQD